MVTLYIKNKALIKFDNKERAQIWIQNYPEYYDNDINNIEMYSDHMPDDSVQINTTLFLRQCPVCTSIIKFELEDRYDDSNIICPNCDTNLGPIQKEGGGY